MKITKEWLKEKNACQEGIDWFLSQTETDAIKLIRKELDLNKFDYANWTITKILQGDDLVKYSIYAAELVLSVYEKEYPNDDRPKKAIEAAKQYLATKTAYAADAAYAAAYAAYAANAAAYAAYAAAYAAYAANAATYAAYAAYAANAANAANAAANAAANMKSKIVEYGIKLIKEMEI